MPTKKERARAERRAERRSGERQSDGDEPPPPPIRNPKGKSKPRPGSLEFEGLEDGGSAQSRFRGLSSGARHSLQKKLAAGGERHSNGDGEEPPPRLGVPYFDAAVHLAEVASRGLIKEAVAGSSGDAALGPEPTVLECLAALSGGEAAGILAVFAELAVYDPRAGGGGKHRAWAAHAGLRCAAFGLEPAAYASITSSEYDPILLQLQECFGLDCCVATGPFGLDLTLESGAAVQAAALRRLLGLAAAVDKPILLGPCKGEGAEAALAALVTEAAGLAGAGARPVVCCDGGAAALWAHPALRRTGRPVYAIIDGTVTFGKASRELLDMAFDMPLDRMLLASSAPLNLPAQARGGRRSVCHSGHVTFVAQRISEIRRGAVSKEQALAASLDNARRCFGERCAPPVAVAAAVAAEEAQDEEREQELKEESARCAGAAEPLCGCVPVSGAAGGVGCLSREELEKRRLA